MTTLSAEIERALENDLRFSHDGIFFLPKDLAFAGKRFPEYGNVVIAAGLEGMGKNEQIIQTFQLKERGFYADPLKEFLRSTPAIREKIRERIGTDIADWTLEDPEQIAQIHEFLKRLKINDIYRDRIGDTARKTPDGKKPNLICDKNIHTGCSFLKLCTDLKLFGYAVENIHLVWILNNKETVCEPDTDDFLITAMAESIAGTMRFIINMGGGIRKYMDGEMWVALPCNDADNTQECFQLKKVGEWVPSYCQINKKIKERIRNFVPGYAGKLWA